MIKEKTVLRKLITTISMLLCVVLLSSVLRAIAQQDPLPLPELSDATPVPTAAQEVQLLKDELNTRVLELYNRDLSSYRVIYITENQTSDTFRVLKQSGVPAVSEWDSVLQMDTSSPLHMLIIDASAQKLVDGEWLRSRYLRGLAVVGIDLTIPQMIELTGDSCTLNPNAPLRYQSDHFYNLYVFALIASHDEDRPALLHSLCDESDGVPSNLKGGFRYTSFGYTGPLATPEDFDAFQQWLIRGAASMEIVELQAEYSGKYVELKAQGVK
jgi:hypothetical protein